jgi:hypothetical protein
MTFTPIPMNAARICDGLSKIGYTPASAICDIIDNSVRAQAQHICIEIVRELAVSDARINNVREYLIIDNGAGMNRNQIINALALGSNADYEQHSLSKFGLGLKSASFSQGEILEIISSRGAGEPFLKYVVSLPTIRERGEYGAEETALSNIDQELIARHLPDAHGTIVRIGTVRKINHPSIKSTLQELRMKAGAIYYYMMRDGNLRITVDGEECVPFDVLFTGEADINGNLDENTWNGRTTCWIERPNQIVVDADLNIKATVEVTQLPHPPTFDRDGPGKQKQIRDRYNIGAKQYGYYVYRNQRLLGWAESFDGIVPQNNDYYAFRGRISIDDTGDEVFNIDVKKSQIHLSEEAYKALDDWSDEYRKKSRKAWQRAGAELRRLVNEEGLVRANTIAAQVDEIEELPGTPDTEEAFQEAQRRTQEIIEEQTERIKGLAASIEDETSEHSGPDGGAATSTEPTSEFLHKVATEGQATPNDKIFLVNNTSDNALWEPYYETGKGTCVRINRLHRFARVLYEDNRNNGAMHILLGLLLHQFAIAETFVQRKYTKHKREDIEDILQEYRRVSTEMLAQLCREAGDSLPSDS